MKKSDLEAALRSTELAFDEVTKQLEHMNTIRHIDEQRISTLKSTIQYLFRAIYTTLSGPSAECSSYLWESLFGSELAALIDINIENEDTDEAKLGVKNQLGTTEGVCTLLVETRRIVLEEIKNR